MEKVINIEKDINIKGSAATEKVKKAIRHGEHQAISFFFKAVKGKQKNESIQKWIDALTEIHFENIKNNVQSKDWTVKIAKGEWIKNGYGKKIFYKLGKI